MVQGNFYRNQGELIQAFPLISGQVNIAAADGAQTTTCFCCSVSGNFTVTFATSIVETIAAAAGEVFAIPGGGTVLAVDGAQFHYV